ncbi:MAG: hypothetical protein M3220_05655 [Chloroflexota bacterium]|nr:hypothetical protein [Chloroflexota bacterium]
MVQKAPTAESSSIPSPEAEPAPFHIGVMKVRVEEQETSNFHDIVDAAVTEVEERLGEMSENLQLDLFEFSGPHLTPVEGAYSPLDFLRLGMTEKVERNLQFLLVVTEVDLSAKIQSFVLALPSRLTNVGVLSTKRLSPTFWGKDAEPTVIEQRLTILMLHTIGHLLNLQHSSDSSNIMHDFEDVEDLDQMQQLTDDQIARFQRNLPIEAREKVVSNDRWKFILEEVTDNWGAIWRAVRQANPLRLAFRLPTMLTAAFSLVLALFFTPDSWDAVGAIGFIPLAFFSVLAILAATAVLYHAFNLRPGSARNKGISEASLVTAAAVLTTMFLTMLLFFLLLLVVASLSAALIIPTEVKEGWGIYDLGIPVPEEVQLGMFLGAMGVLGGSLGATAASKELIRSVVFLDEET